MSITLGHDIIENEALNKKLASCLFVNLCIPQILKVIFLKRTASNEEIVILRFPLVFTHVVSYCSLLIPSGDTRYMCTVHISGDYLYWWYNNGLCVFSVERSIGSNWNSWLDKASSGSLLDSVCGSRNRIIAI